MQTTHWRRLLPLLDHQTVPRSPAIKQPAAAAVVAAGECYLEAVWLQQQPVALPD
jgi:hypothetical protein